MGDYTAHHLSFKLKEETPKAIVDFFDNIFGDIFARQIFEDNPNEWQFWIDFSNQIIAVDWGIRYKTAGHNYLCDSRHPYRTEEGDEPFSPIMNRYVLLERGEVEEKYPEYHTFDGARILGAK